MSLEELGELLSSKDVAASSFVLLPVFDVLVGVVPDQVCHQSRVGNVGWLWDLVNLLEAMHVFAESSVHAHDLLIDESHQGHVVEARVELLPQVDLVPPLDLVEEPVDARDGLALVVASQDDHLLWEPHFQGQQQTNDLAALLATVDIVSHEQVPSILGNDEVILFCLVLVAHFLEHVDQVRVLAVDVTEDFDWCFKLDEWLLFFETLLGTLDQGFDDLDGQVHKRHTLGILGLISDDVVV